MTRASTGSGTRSRSAEHYAAYAEAGREGMYGRDWTLWRDLLTDDIGNLRAALGWAIAHGDRELALRIAVALRTFWDLRWLTPEGDEWLSRALAVPGGTDPTLEARAMLALSAYAAPGALTLKEAADTAQLAAATFRRCGDAAGEAEALVVLGGLLAAGERDNEARKCSPGLARCARATSGCG